MNLLIVTPILSPDIGGPATYVPQIIARLGEKQVTVITFTKNPDPIPSTKILSISQTGSSLGRQVRLLVTLLKMGLEADLIYAQDPEVTGFASIIAGKILRKPVLVKYVGDPAWEKNFGRGNTKKFLNEYLEKPDSGIMSQFEIALTHLVFRLATKIITPSKFLEKIVTERYGINKNKISVIYNAIDIFSKPKRKFVKKHIYKIITVGRLVNWKRIDGIIRAVKFLNQSSPDTDIKLTVVGDGPDRQKLEAIKDKNVFFAGKLSQGETQSMIRASDLLILNSVYEGLPHTILEAFALGTPVVATNIAGTNELAINHKTALTVDPDNDKQLSGAIQEITDSPKLSELLTDNALALVKEAYSWDTTTKELKTTITNLVS
jgi:glycosyltransferase involved in cell wall biosynthesis